MSVVTYETMFLLDANKVSTDADGTKQQIHHVLERHGATLIVSRPWDYNHKLAYPIGKQKKGAFHIIYYTMESTNQRDLERDFALQEGLILRQLTLKLVPKWQEAMLTIARDDASNGFALRGMQDEATVQTDPAAIGMEPVPFNEDGAAAPAGAGREGAPPRRGGRRDMVDKPE